MTTCIQFTNVGREKRSWVQSVDEDIAAPTFLGAIERRARAGGKIVSASLDAEWCDEVDGRSGILTVGGFRTIGSWKVLSAEEIAAQEAIDFKNELGTQAPQTLREGESNE